MTLPHKLAVKTIAIAPAWLAVPLVIWFVDPHGLLRPHPDDGERARLVAAGHAVVWPDSANHREFVRQLIPQMPKYDIVVIGSSRVFRIHKEWFEGRSFANLGITCATLEELRGIVELLRREGKTPDNLIVGVDPWTFNPAHLQRSPDRCLRSKGAIVAPNERVQLIRVTQTLISPAYFQLSLQSLGKTSVAIATDEHLMGNDYLRLADGSLRVTQLPDIPGVRASDQVQARVQQAIRDRIWTEYEYSTGDEPLRKAFAEMVLSVPAATLLLVPLHPDFYRALQVEPGCQRALAQEAWLREFAAEHQIPVIGSFDPQRCSKTAADFVDANHCDELAMIEFSRELAAWVPPKVESSR